MLNINNKVSYEINIKRKEKKYSWSTVFAWLYLKTIGRILPKRWNRWAENILYYDKTTANNEVQTDAFKTIDGSVQVDLKPEVVEKESQSVVINKDGGVQTDGVALITEEDDEALEEQLEGINQELELERLQNASLKEENRELRSAIEGLEKSYKGLTEDAGEREEELTKYKQDKKAMRDKVDEQQKTIFDQYMIIREQGEEIEATRKDNESLQAQIIELKSRLKDKEDKLIELNQQWQASKLVALLKSQTDKLWQAKNKNTELENKVSDLGNENKALRLSMNTLTAQLGEMENLGKQLQSAQESKQQLEKERIDLESKLKDLSSQLSAAEVEKKSSENEVSKLQKQVQILEESKEWELAGIGDTLNKASLSVMELLAQQLPLNNQEQQNLEKELKNVDKKLESINKKTKEQTEAKAPDAVSTVSTAKSTTGSMKSTQSKFSKILNLKNKNLNDFLSDKNKELKENVPEFEKKHFCHNVHNKTIKFLSNKNSGKFESKELLELLENNLKQSAREIIEAKVKEVVNEHYNIGKNVGKELQDGTLKAKLSPSVRKCVKELELNKQKEGVNKIVNSILHSFNSENNNNNDSVELLKEIATEKLTEAKMKCFASKIQELQLASSIRDKFLSPDQKMCSQIPGKGNMYKLSTEGINKVNGPNSSLSHTNTVSVRSLNAQRVA